MVELSYQMEIDKALRAIEKASGPTKCYFVVIDDAKVFYNTKEEIDAIRKTMMKRGFAFLRSYYGLADSWSGDKEKEWQKQRNQLPQTWTLRSRRCSRR